MKKIYIYYSLTGNGDIVGAKMNDLGYDVRKIHVKRELPKLFFFRMMVGGFKALIGYKDKIIDFDYDIDNYKEVVIGCPVWFDRLCSPVNTILNNINLNNKKLSFILYSGSGECKRGVSFIKNKYRDSKITILKEPLKNLNELDKIW